MKIFIGCSSKEPREEIYKSDAKKLAEVLAKNNDLVFGSSNEGLMGIVYREFLKQNRHITGICYEMYRDLLKDLDLSETIMVKTLGESTDNLIKNSDVLIFFPGAYGTLSELISCIELVRTKVYDRKIILYNRLGFFDGLIATFDKAYENNLTSNKWDELVIVKDNIEDIIKTVEEL